MKNTIKRTLFGLFCVVMAYVFVACSNGEPPFIPVVNYTEEEVSSSVNEIPAGTYTIYHLRQKTTGGTDPSAYERYFYNYKSFSKASKLSDVAKSYPGFSAQTMTLNENAVYVYYNRNTITYTFNLDDKGSFKDGTKTKTVSGLYGSSVLKPARADIVLSDATKYRFSKWRLKDGASVPSVFGVDNIDDIVAVWVDPSTITVPEGFVEIPDASITGSETWTPYSSVFVSGRKLNIEAFWMSDHEVTRGEYKKIMGSDPSYAKANDKDGNELTGDAADNNPVNVVNWYDAIVYCNKRSIKEGLTPCYTINGSTNPNDWGAVPTSSDSTWNAATCDFEVNGYRLPTEAEWEWAARGGENYKYAGSDNLDDVAWYTENTNDTGTREVKTKKPNGYGLYDMSGNVFEWCWDWYGSVNSSTPASGSSSGSYRCLRGGSWYFHANYCTVADRNYNNPYSRHDYSGFRLVRSAQ